MPFTIERIVGSVDAELELLELDELELLELEEELELDESVAAPWPVVPITVSALPAAICSPVAKNPARKMPFALLVPASSLLLAMAPSTWAACLANNSMPGICSNWETSALARAGRGTFEELEGAAGLGYSLASQYLSIAANIGCNSLAFA